MPLETENSKTFINNMFKELENVCTIDDIKNEENFKFVFFSHRYIEEKNKVPGTNYHSWKTFPCIIVGETVGKKFKKGPMYGTKVRYRELPSNKLHYMNKDTIVFKFPEHILAGLIINDSVKSIIK